MSLLASSSRSLKAQHLPAELLASLFHTCPPQYGSASPSRRKLVKSLEPKSKGGSAGRLEVAPRRSRFERDSVPHTEAKDQFEARKEWMHTPGPKFTQRRRTQDDRRPPPRRFERREDTTRSALPPSIPDHKPLDTTITPVKSQKQVQELIGEEFELSHKGVSTKQLPTEFTSPPLMDGLLSSLLHVLGPNAQPTPIQALSLKHLLSTPTGSQEWKQFLLASETGSGKSIAYLLPLLQALKQGEMDGTASRSSKGHIASPRALVLAPTHELTRQLSIFAKSLIHNIKLRITCASRANVPTHSKRHVTASKMASELEVGGSQEGGEFLVSPQGNSARPVDLLVGTPSKVLEMVKGRGWDHERRDIHIEDTWGTDEHGRKIRPKKFTVGPPEIGLENVEWVIVDEADVLFDPDFQESTRMLLADIATARGQTITFNPEMVLPSPNSTAPAPTIEVPNYPFNLIFTTATIPSSLASYLDNYHPSLTRLASPNLHKLPSSLRTEYESWTGGRREKDVENRIRKVWWEDAIAAGHQATSESVTSDTGFEKSKILIFCNKSARVEDLGKYLTERGIPNVALTSTSETRQIGNNSHLDAFLRERAGGLESSDLSKEDRAKQPHVLITTSLLSRGLDFAPSIKHVFIMDAPRNMIDFLHRAGRSGRAGEKGKVVIFGKGKGRGAAKDRDVRSRVKALVA
ncbi:hypothetical protein QCA50_008667 [Cerrena zonata]|uniref:RNA helicase n=1 Tax=Cerrena zonata TaxID=2478898 RepID=A0AAW0G4P4_9APHY